MNLHISIAAMEWLQDQVNIEDRQVPRLLPPLTLPMAPKRHWSLLRLLRWPKKLGQCEPSDCIDQLYKKLALLV